MLPNGTCLSTLYLSSTIHFANVFLGSLVFDLTGLNCALQVNNLNKTAENVK